MPRLYNADSLFDLYDTWQDEYDNGFGRQHHAQNESQIWQISNENKENINDHDDKNADSTLEKHLQKRGDRMPQLWDITHDNTGDEDGKQIADTALETEIIKCCNVMKKIFKVARDNNVEGNALRMQRFVDLLESASHNYFPLDI